MERSAITNVLTMVRKGETTVKEGAKMIELIEKDKKFIGKIGNRAIILQEKTNTYVSPMYTGGYLIEYFSVPKNI